MSSLKNLKLLEKPLPVTKTLLLGRVVAPNVAVPNIAEPNNEAELKLPTAKFPGCGTSPLSKSYLILSSQSFCVPSGSILVLTLYKLFLKPLSP